MDGLASRRLAASLGCVRDHAGQQCFRRSDAMKHVAVLFEFPTLNGGEHSMLAVLSQLNQQPEFRFSALAPPTGLLAEELSRIGIPHIAFSVRDASDTKRSPAELLQHLSSIMAELSPDIVHANSLSMSRLLGQMGTASTSFCRTGHLRDIIRLKKQVISDLNHNDALVAVSHATFDFHVAQGLDSQRCQVIYNGVDTDVFQLRDRLHWRAQLLPYIPDGATVLLCVGQICLRKGQLDLARSVCQLLGDGGDAHLVIVGKRHSAKAESIEYERLIQQEFVDAEHQAHLHLLGHRNDINKLMNAADVLVHAAYQEPFGRVLLEAAASQLPVVATHVGGTAEMLAPDAEAILVPPGDCPALTAALAQLINDSARRTKLATAARQKIERRFRLATASGLLAEFWRSV